MLKLVLIKAMVNFFYHQHSSQTNLCLLGISVLLWYCHHNLVPRTHACQISGVHLETEYDHFALIGNYNLWSLASAKCVSHPLWCQSQQLFTCDLNFEEWRSGGASQMQIYLKLKLKPLLHYWTDLPLALVEQGLLCRYLCLQVQKKKPVVMYPKCFPDPTFWKRSPAKNHNPPPTSTTLAITKPKPFQACYG